MGRIIITIAISFGSLIGFLLFGENTTKQTNNQDVVLMDELLLVQPTPTPLFTNIPTEPPTPATKAKIHQASPSPTPEPTTFPWPTPMPTVTPQPTPTPMLTPTPQPTPTPIPTNIPTPTPTIFFDRGGCSMEGHRQNCRQPCCQEGRCGYWNVDPDQLAKGKIVYTECVIVE